MSDPIIPNCAITLYFFESEDRFSYVGTNSSLGWQVQPDGSIHPPSSSRVIQFSLNDYPARILFGAFQIAVNPQDFPSDSTHWPPLPPQVTVVSPTPYPPPQNDATLAGPLIFDFGGQVTRLSYRLAVVVESDPTVLHWDEPKIYDDGSQ